VDDPQARGSVVTDRIDRGGLDIDRGRSMGWKIKLPTVNKAVRAQTSSLHKPSVAGSVAWSMAWRKALSTRSRRSVFPTERDSYESSDRWVWFTLPSMAITARTASFKAGGNVVGGDGFADGATTIVLRWRSRGVSSSSSDSYKLSPREVTVLGEGVTEIAGVGRRGAGDASSGSVNRIKALLEGESGVGVAGGTRAAEKKREGKVSLVVIG